MAGPVHDALLVESFPPTPWTKPKPSPGASWRAASRTVLKGHALGVDVKRWVHPQRFMDEKRGLPTWNKIMGYLQALESLEKSGHGV